MAGVLAPAGAAPTKAPAAPATQVCSRAYFSPCHSYLLPSLSPLSTCLALPASCVSQY
jgi:hypothetical protein